jgi:hypothetical protein
MTWSPARRRREEVADAGHGPVEHRRPELGASNVML